MNKKLLSIVAVFVAAGIAVLCVLFILDFYNKGLEVPDRVWGLLGVMLALLFGIQLPTPGQKQ